MASQFAELASDPVSYWNPDDRAQAVAARVLRESAPDAAVQAYAAMSDVARRYIDRQAERASMTTDAFLRQADADRIATAAASTEARDIAKAARR